MNYKITILVEDENENKICELNTSAGMADFEENVLRKAEHAIRDYEDKQEVKAQMEMDRQTEDNLCGKPHNNNEEGNCLECEAIGSNL